MEFSEGVSFILGKLFGTASERVLGEVRPAIAQIKNFCL
jgi:hypothetical protein